uniref:Uncharacterized protein n=1 Tax=Trichuris muris TaxID=70415 RepID=A0A5S6QPF9_TRIMR
MEVTAVCNTIKRRAEETMETPAMIVNGTCAGTSTVTLAQLPSSDAMKMIIQRKRRIVQGAPPQPTHRASIVVPESYQIYREEERSLLYDSALWLLLPSRQKLEEKAAPRRSDSKVRHGPSFALTARMIASLAFVPFDSLDGALNDLSRELPAELLCVLDWFEENMFGSEPIWWPSDPAISARDMVGLPNYADGP